MRDLCELLASPARGADATHDEAGAALQELSAVLGVLTARLRPDSEPTQVDAPVASDRALTAAEAAARLGVSPRWLRGRDLPFTVKVSPRCVRYSAAGVEKFIRNRKSLA